MTELPNNGRMDIAALSHNIVPLRDGYLGLKIKHRRTDTMYKIVGFTFQEMTMGIMFLYIPDTDRKYVPFARPIKELFDGRFEIELKKKVNEQRQSA